MKANKIITTLGCLALILLSLYFVYGLLKIGGEGLASLGYSSSVIEGMTEKEEKNYTSKFNETAAFIEKKMEEMKTGDETRDVHARSIVNLDDVEGFSDLKEEVIDYVSFMRKYMVNATILEIGLSKERWAGTINKVVQSKSSSLHLIEKYDKFLNALKSDGNTGGGVAKGGAATKGGLFG